MLGSRLRLGMRFVAAEQLSPDQPLPFDQFHPGFMCFNRLFYNFISYFLFKI